MHSRETNEAPIGLAITLAAGSGVVTSGMVLAATAALPTPYAVFDPTVPGNLIAPKAILPSYSVDTTTGAQPADAITGAPARVRASPFTWGGNASNPQQRATALDQLVAQVVEFCEAAA